MRWVSKLRKGEGYGKEKSSITKSSSDQSYWTDDAIAYFRWLIFRAMAR
ncbi:hypothetical protein [Alkaliphilus hydrothermalis]|uniref:Uncharacterized protein n=1 Tax=Alkaliphilus hydrothermalis TaxID=1482730 RepID=A0ABS2NQB0_9FIRM|nr:hypothetical protein [Alkaliphilus hydrothermalis]MBM7615121.1 hypothetical protein [Alkaliphilus hydrothermalis]